LIFPLKHIVPDKDKWRLRFTGLFVTRGQAIIQAPTGIGKTMAALYPALKAMNGGFAEKIFYLTARTTGKSAAESALQLLKTQGLRLKSIIITAKNKICFNPDCLCNAQECEFAKRLL
jgi:DNA excision repair protein ERCC-2